MPVATIFLDFRRNRNGFPRTEQQLGNHQIRNSTKYVPYKDIKAVMADLKKVYGAPTLTDAEYRLENFGNGAKISPNFEVLDTNWAELTYLSTRRRFGLSSIPPTQSRDFIECCENTPDKDHLSY